MYDKGFRIAAIKLYNYIGNMQKTARALGIGIATIWRWIHNGIDPIKKYKTSVPETLLVFTKCQIENNNSITQTDLIRLVKQHLGLNISRKCIATVLKILNFSRKRLRHRGFTTPGKYKEKLDIFRDSIKNNNKTIISIDEIGFDQRMLPIYGYSIKGTKAIGLTHSTNRKRINVIAAIDSNNKIFYKLINGSVNTIEFNNFIKELPWTENSTLIMDNVSFHKSKVVLDSAKGKNFELIFIPPYTPDCNPIENVFSVVKNNYRKRILDLSLNQNENIKLCFNELDKSSFKRCFNRMYNFINL